MLSQSALRTVSFTKQEKEGVPMETPLTASNKQDSPRDKQVGKLHERLIIAAKKSGVTPEQFQAALEYPGTELEDEVAGTFLRFSKRASGVFTPVAARETGLVPDWCEKIEKDELEGDVELAKLDFTYCPVHKGEEYVTGDTMLARAGKVVAIGSLGLGKIILDAQKEGKEIVPADVQVVILPRTILRYRIGYRHVPYLYRYGAQLVLNFIWLGNNFDRDGRLVRPRE